MRITNVEIIPIYPRLVERNAAYNAHFPNWNLRTVFKVTADNGLVGYGDYRCPPPPRSTAEPLIGRDPFDFIGNQFNPALGAALYDLMGKYLEVPAYKLMGQKVRNRVPVAAWTKPASPDKLREEVPRAVSEGYTVMKMHTCEYYDVFEQNRAVEEVAPDGFLMHYDLNANRSITPVLPILNELEKSRVAGFIEDPLKRADIDGWRRLREKSRLPIILMIPQLGGVQEIIHGMADAYMGGGPIGTTLQQGSIWAGANVAGLLQFTGGTLTKALAMHLAAVMPTCSLHSVDLDDQYEDDVVRERLPIIEGCSPVPEGPGLGVEVDEDELARLAANPPTPVPKHVAALRLRGGHSIYYPSLATVDVHRMTGKEEGTIRGLTLDLWDDDGSAAFERVYKRVQTDGPFVE
jgi:L-alanine-DL-glutamate epimerase-like enolase superfamily enzyme